VVVIAAAALVLLRRLVRVAEHIVDRAAAAPVPAVAPSPPPAPLPPQDQSPTPPEARSELESAWVQFLRDEVAEAANALNNRLAVITSLHQRFDASGLAPEQRRDLEQIGTELERAAGITATLVSRASSGAPGSIPTGFVALSSRARRQGVILLVEDDDGNREAISRLLSVAGHRVIPARDGIEAFGALETATVDCVVSDVRMPALGGRGLYQQVEERMPEMARLFVFVTGDYARPETRDFLVETGCPVVTKPYQIETRLHAVAAVLERAEVLRPKAPVSRPP
jgi:CheY-like chemotaxis protein